MLPDTPNSPLPTTQDAEGSHGNLGTRHALSTDAAGKVIKADQDFKAIPYYAWANRGPGQMMVWIPNSKPRRSPPRSRHSPPLPRSRYSRQPQEPRNMIDGEDPAAMRRCVGLLRLVAKEGSAEWVELAFEKPATISREQRLLVRRHRARRSASPCVRVNCSYKMEISGNQSKPRATWGEIATSTTG
jgi:hypothetical protein